MEGKGVIRINDNNRNYVKELNQYIGDAQSIYKQ